MDSKHIEWLTYKIEFPHEKYVLVKLGKIMRSLSRFSSTLLELLWASRNCDSVLLVRHLLRVSTTYKQHFCLASYMHLFIKLVLTCIFNVVGCYISFHFFLFYMVFHGSNQYWAGWVWPVYRYSVDIFFHIQALQECWVLAESRILLKHVLGGVRIVALSKPLKRRDHELKSHLTR